MAMLTIDPIEYSSDALAQAAYTSSATIGSSVYVGSGSNFATIGSASGISWYDDAVKPVGAFDGIADSSHRWGCLDNVQPMWLKLDLGSGNSFVANKFRTMQVTQPSGTWGKHWQLSGSVDGVTYTPIATGTLTNYTVNYANLWDEWTFPANTSSYRYYMWNYVDNWSNEGYFSVMENELYAYTSSIATASLWDYSDGVIFSSGSYSLKGTIDKNALNQTLTHTLTASLDLSTYNFIYFDVRSNITGSNFELHIHDTGGAIHSKSINTITSGAWQEEKWNISQIPTNEKDAIDYIALKVTNVTNDNIFHLDNIYASDVAIPNPVTIDPIEYATNALIQAAYTSSATGSAGAFIGSGSDVTYNNGPVTASSTDGSHPANGAIDNILPTGDGATRWGTNNLPCWLKWDMGSGGAKSINKFREAAINGPNGAWGKNFSISASNDDSTYVPIYRGQIPYVVGPGTYYPNPPIWNDFEFTGSSTAYRWWKIDFYDVWDTGVGYVSMMEIELYSYTSSEAIQPALLAYTSSLVTTGSYALQAVANTSSINQILTHTLTASLDLSTYHDIYFDARASRTGSNFEILMYDDGGAINSHSIDITTSGSWQQEVWDISNIVEQDRDSIYKIAFKVINADADNIFYADYIYAYSSSVAPEPSNTRMLLIVDSSFTS